MSAIIFLQTADPYKYFEMLVTTSRANREFCNRHNHRYQAFIGIKAGHFAWHATYNRIFLMHELLQTEFRGWVVYLDADAYVADLDFDLADFLDSHEHTGILGAPGGDQVWNINAGILMMNLGNDSCRQVLNDWHSLFFSLVSTDQIFRTSSSWPQNFSNDDQTLLHIVLSKMESITFLEKIPLKMFGGDTSSYVRQILRQYGSFEERLAFAAADVEGILRLTKM